MTTGIITYLKAVSEDGEALFAMLRDMHAEGGFLPLDEKKARAQMDAVIRDGLVMVARDGKTIVGSIGIAPSEHWYSSAPVWADFWTYVRPAWRKSRLAPELLSFVTDYVKRQGITLFMAVTSPHETDRKENLFARHLRPVGRIFMEDGGHVLRR